MQSRGLTTLLLLLFEGRQGWDQQENGCCWKEMGCRAMPCCFNIFFQPGACSKRPGSKAGCPNRASGGFGVGCPNLVKGGAVLARRGMGANVQSSLQVDACVLQPAVLQGGFLPCNNRAGMFQAAAAFLAGFPQHVRPAALQALQHSSRAQVALLQGGQPRSIAGKNGRVCTKSFS